MLVLSRKVGERVKLGHKVRVTVLACAGGRIRLGIEAPRGVRVLREELVFAPAEASPQQDDPVRAPAATALLSRRKAR